MTESPPQSPAARWARALLARSRLLYHFEMERRTLMSRLTRGRIVRRYLASESLPRLNIGAGENLLDGWLNTDVRIYRRGRVIWLDATQPFPMPRDAFAFIATEHQFEHIDRMAGQRMLAECLRVLRPGGTLRLATPDLTWVGLLAASSPGPDQRRYLEWMSAQLGLPGTDPAAVVNLMFRGCGSHPDSGHQFVYSFDALRAAMEAAGFVDVRRCQMQESAHPALRNIERHGEAVGDAEIVRLETLIVEGDKPIVSR